MLDLYHGINRGNGYIEYTSHSVNNDYTKNSNNFDENLFLSNHILYTDKDGNTYNEFKFDATATVDGGITYDQYGRVSAIYFYKDN